MNERLNIPNFADLLAEKHGMEKSEAEFFIREFFLLIEQALESDKYVKIKGLGTFKLIDVDSRESVNVNTGERFKIEGHSKVSFTPESSLRDLINKPFAHFETVVLNENTILEDTLPEGTEDEMEESPELVELLEITESREEPETIAEDSRIAVEEEHPVEVETIQEIAKITTPIVESIQKEAKTAEEIIAEEISKEDTVRLKIVQEEIPPVRPVVPEIVRETAASSKHKESKSPVAYLVAMIAVVLFLCVGALGFVYYPDLFSFTKEADTTLPPVAKVTVPETLLDTVAKADTVAEVVPDVKREQLEEVSAKNRLKEVAPSAEKESVKVAAIPVKPDSVNYVITGTKTLYTLKEGETLTKVSLRFYGTKDLWPYILKYNRDVIKNPDSVPYGTTLKIPELAKK